VSEIDMDGAHTEIDDYQPGKELDRREVVLDEALLDRYLRTVDEEATRYADGSHGGPSVVPGVALVPELFALEERSVPPTWGPDAGVLTASVRWRNRKTVRVGEVVSLVTTVVDRLVRNGREYLTTEMAVRDAGGDVVSAGAVTVFVPVRGDSGGVEE
jgi:hypothetical protein